MPEGTGREKSGSNFEILVDGKPRSYRDDASIAIEAAKYLKSKQPNSEVALRDIRTNVSTPVAWVADMPQSTNRNAN